MAEPPFLAVDDAVAWFSAQLPDDWFSAIEVLVDRDEIMVIGTLAADDEQSDGGASDGGTTSGGTTSSGADEGDGDRELRELTAIARFRERTRDQRIAIAQRAEAKYLRKVAWAACCGDTHAPFTHLNVPVMTRLRIDERQVLDTLVAAGAARSRSDALVWCVRRVANLENDWLEELRTAISAVDSVRAKGPA